jgi:hypothetical protein
LVVRRMRSIWRILMKRWTRGEALRVSCRRSASIAPLTVRSAGRRWASAIHEFLGAVHTFWLYRQLPMASGRGVTVSSPFRRMPFWRLSMRRSGLRRPVLIRSTRPRSRVRGTNVVGIVHPAIVRILLASSGGRNS